MISLTIAPEFQAVIPSVAVGCVTAAVRNSEHEEPLWQEIEVLNAIGAVLGFLSDRF